MIQKPFRRIPRNSRIGFHFDFLFGRFGLLAAPENLRNDGDEVWIISVLASRTREEFGADSAALAGNCKGRLFI
jgi:hypothetical protein